MDDILSFVDWLTSSVSTWWIFWGQQHLVFRAIIVSGFVLMVVGLVAKTIKK